MLISISGASGCGKSTLLDKLSEKYPVLPNKISRTIISEMGKTLQEINSDLDLTIEFQKKILERKYNDELKHANTDQIVLVERSYADLATFMVANVGRFNEYGPQVSDYIHECAQSQKMYQYVLLLSPIPDSMKPKDWYDGIRASNRYYVEMLDATLQRFTALMTGSRYSQVTSHDNDERYTIIDRYLQQIQ